MRSPNFTRSEIEYVCVDDITAFVHGRNKELVEMEEKVVENMKREVEEKGLKLSVTEGGKEGKSKATSSCRYLAARRKELLWRRVLKRRPWT